MLSGSSIRVDRFARLSDGYDCDFLLLYEIDENDNICFSAFALLWHVDTTVNGDGDGR